MTARMETLIALGSMVVFTILCGSVYSAVKRAGARRAASLANAKRKLLVHSINKDRCTGCESCVNICPANVLQLDDRHKSTPVRFDVCIQCSQCMIACPSIALVMHYEGDEPPPIRLPNLDRYYQAAPGMYLIGEAAGKPLVKNSSNLGRTVVEHMVKNGLKPGGARDGQTFDVFIVGSGPGGLSAALSCASLGLTYKVIEKDDRIASTIARYPKGKFVMAEPEDVRCVGLLPVWDSSKEEMIAHWQKLLTEKKIQVQLKESVENVKKAKDGLFDITSADAAGNKHTFRAQRVVLAIGTRGKPRKLGVDGDGLPKVAPLLNDPEDHRGQRVVVVGGGDSAVEAACSLAETAKSVLLSYRGKALSRCKARNRQALDALREQKKVDVRFNSQIQSIAEDKVVLKTGDKVEDIKNDFVIVCIGGDAPVKWMQSVGVQFTEQPHMFQRENTDKLLESLVGRVKDTPTPAKAKMPHHGAPSLNAAHGRAH